MDRFVMTGISFLIVAKHQIRTEYLTTLAIWISRIWKSLSSWEAEIGFRFHDRVHFFRFFIYRCRTSKAYQSCAKNRGYCRGHEFYVISRCLFRPVKRI